MKPKAKKTTKRQSPAFKTIVRSLDHLTDEDLTDLDAILHGLIEAREDEVEAQAEAAQAEAKASAKKGARGHIELKMINGYGPYKYLRFWQGKTLKSEYIGKAKK